MALFAFEIIFLIIQYMIFLQTFTFKLKEQICRALRLIHLKLLNCLGLVSVSHLIIQKFQPLYICLIIRIFFFKKTLRKLFRTKQFWFCFVCLSVFLFLLLGMLTTTVISFFLDDTPSSRQFVKKKVFSKRIQFLSVFLPIYIFPSMFLFSIYIDLQSKKLLFTNQTENIFIALYFLCVWNCVFLC